MGGEQPAIDRHAMAGEARGEQEVDDGGDFLRPAGAAQRHKRGGRGGGSGAEGGSGALVFGDEARDDGGNRDALRGQLHRQRAHQHLEPGLGRGGGGKQRPVGADGMGTEGGDGDDGGLLGHPQPPQGGADQGVEAREDGAMGAVEGGRIELGGRRAVGIAGIGHQLVQPPEPGEAGGDQGGRRFRVGEIAGQAEGGGTGGLGGGSGGGETGAVDACVQRERRARAGQPARQRGADAGGRAGDEGDPGQAGARRRRIRPSAAIPVASSESAGGSGVGVAKARLVTQAPPE